MGERRSIAEPWERQVREPAVAFQAFLHFLEGHDLLAIARLVAKHRNTLGRWRATYRWDDRRDALEAERDAKLMAKIRTRRREVVEKHLTMLDAGEALVAQAFQQLNGKADLATLPQAARALRHIIDAKRNIIGLPTATVVTRPGPAITEEELTDASAILRDPELLAEYDRLAARLAAKGGGSVAPDAGGSGGAAESGPVETSPAP